MNPEHLPSHAERGGAELEKAAHEQAEKLKGRYEKAGESSPEKQAERAHHARKETKEIFAREAGKEQRSGGEPSARAVRRVTRSQKQATYKHTMKHVQSEMNPAARTFSKVIHTPVVEKASDALGSTVARPNALLAGSMSAFILVTIVYMVARYYGYPLSGFESIGAFIVGWIIGLIYDYARLARTTRR